MTRTTSCFTDVPHHSSGYSSFLQKPAVGFVLADDKQNARNNTFILRLIYYEINPMDLDNSVYVRKKRFLHSQNYHYIFITRRCT